MFLIDPTEDQIMTKIARIFPLLVVDGGCVANWITGIVDNSDVDLVAGFYGD